MLKKIKTIIILSVSFILNFNFSVFAADGDLSGQMNPVEGTENTIMDASGSGTDSLDSVFAFFRDTIFTFVSVVAIGVFLYFGFKLITAQGNEEEMKKSMKGFAYAVVGIAVIPLAWALIKLVSSLSF